jgi:fluoride exporter
LAKLLWIALGGALGALSRHGVGIWAERLWGDGFPWGTFLVNALGSFVLGLLIEAFVRTDAVSPGMRAALTTGFLGAFTTFSTYSVQSIRLFERGEPGMALLNIGGNVIVGLILAAAGIATARAWISEP